MVEFENMEQREVLETPNLEESPNETLDRKLRAYFDGKRVLIDGGDTFRDYIRADKDAQNLIKDLIQEVTGTRCPIGPYQPPQTEDASPARDLEATVQHLQAQGVELVKEDK